MIGDGLHDGGDGREVKSQGDAGDGPMRAGLRFSARPTLVPQKINHAGRTWNETSPQAIAGRGGPACVMCAAEPRPGQSYAGDVAQSPRMEGASRGNSTEIRGSEPEHHY